MTLDEDLAAAHATFHNFPGEVFGLWLDDRIKQNGWPPSGLEWEGFLVGRSVTSWQAFHWNKELLSLSQSNFSDSTLCRAKLLIEANVLGRSNIMTDYIPNTRQRFASVLGYIKVHNKLLGTIVLLRSGMKYDVVEGNHRIAALLALPILGAPFNIARVSETEAWVASEH